ncbi:hypothetical protein OGAPHI_006638 [Ogataea philodendri]|uniref:Zn(2)-C6 fungal-type domain-containing protein n=1 Tax=Ogataea philodendri TaxID=1378263 RepID=A0A9P8T0A6_9ASCO|nr:uncharacterized protein OGAPHI_006638 [Ogataea philodendri]KAH3661231.1 hypothetical protein OGAPHI_006638 [Ogataea philodendri]
MTQTPNINTQSRQQDEKSASLGPRKRSKAGCMMCKIRKKRCDEAKPTCGDCSRLNKECHYVTDEMSTEEIRRLRNECKRIDAGRKCRNRKPKTITTPGPMRTESESPKVVFNPLSVRGQVGVDFIGKQEGVDASNTIWNTFYENIMKSVTMEARTRSPSPAPDDLMPMAFPETFSPNITKFLHDLPDAEIRASPSEELTPFYPEQVPRISICMNPSLTANSPVASLSDVGRRLYDYFRNNLCHVVSLVDEEKNMYLRTFIPMSHVDKSVLYGILAWSAFHLGGSQMEKQGQYYINKAIGEISSRPLLRGESKENYDRLIEVLDEDDEKVVKEEQLSDSAALSGLNYSDKLNLRLAAYLILCGVEICKGDVTKWFQYLNYGADLIKMKGGIQTFNDSRDEHFLITNYAYHDMTSASVVEDRQLHFDLHEYEDMWMASNRIGFLDPLLGLSSPVFKVLAEINQLVMKSRLLLRHYKEMPSLDEELGGSTMSQDWYKKQLLKAVEENKYTSVSEVYEEVMKECSSLDSKLNTAAPNYMLMNGMDATNFELQLTMFEAFQLAAKIHLRQSVMKMNSSSLEIQHLVDQLVASLDILLGSNLEAALCFPLFIAGMNCIYTQDRKQMDDRIDEFVKRYRWRSIGRCQLVMKEVWAMNECGERWVDWYEIVRKLGWDLSFA